MKVVNLGDPYVKRLTLRLTDIQYKHIIHMSSDLETSPSGYIRYLIMQSALIYDQDLLSSGVNVNENVKTDSNNNI